MVALHEYMNYIDHIPKEIISIILYNLPINSFYFFACVSKKYEGICIEHEYYSQMKESIIYSINDKKILLSKTLIHLLYNGHHFLADKIIMDYGLRLEYRNTKINWYNLCTPTGSKSHIINKDRIIFVSPHDIVAIYKNKNESSVMHIHLLLSFHKKKIYGKFTVHKFIRTLIKNYHIDFFKNIIADFEYVSDEFETELLCKTIIKSGKIEFIDCLLDMNILINKYAMLFLSSLACRLGDVKIFDIIAEICERRGYKLSNKTEYKLADKKYSISSHLFPEPGLLFSAINSKNIHMVKHLLQYFENISEPLNLMDYFDSVYWADNSKHIDIFNYILSLVDSKPEIYGILTIDKISISQLTVRDTLVNKAIVDLVKNKKYGSIDFLKCIYHENGFDPEEDCEDHRINDIIYDLLGYPSKFNYLKALYEYQQDPLLNQSSIKIIDPSSKSNMEYILRCAYEYNRLNVVKWIENIIEFDHKTIDLTSSIINCVKYDSDSTLKYYIDSNSSFDIHQISEKMFLKAIGKSSYEVMKLLIELTDPRLEITFHHSYKNKRKPEIYDISIKLKDHIMTDCILQRINIHASENKALLYSIGRNKFRKSYNQYYPNYISFKILYELSTKCGYGDLDLAFDNNHIIRSLLCPGTEYYQQNDKLKIFTKILEMSSKSENYKLDFNFLIELLKESEESHYKIRLLELISKHYNMNFDLIRDLTK